MEHTIKNSRENEEMADNITRPECKEEMDKIDAKVESIQLSVTSMEVSSKNIENMVNKLYTMMYGNGKPGLIEKISGYCTKVNIQWFLLGCIIIGVIAMAFKAK